MQRVALGKTVTMSKKKVVKSDLETFLEKGILPVGKRMADNIKWQPLPVAELGQETQEGHKVIGTRIVKRHLMWPVAAGEDQWWRYQIDNNTYDTIEIFEYHLQGLANNRATSK